MNQPKALRRIIDTYFQDPKAMIAVAAGTEVLRQDGYNDRLYWVKQGELSGYVNSKENDLSAQVFVVKEGMFFGVHSFFAQTLVASTEKEKALQKLYATEQMTTLGQLAAGIAHELNNAIGVISSKTENIQTAISQFVDDNQPQMRPFLQHGIDHGQSISSAQVRERSKVLQQQYTLSREHARTLARALPEGDVPADWLKDIDAALICWDSGRDLRDIRLAARHAASIVRSVKQLGGGDHARIPNVDITDTLHKSLALLQSNLRYVDVVLRPAILPPVTASITELVQIWVNLIKNACDAMEHTDNPQIEIITRSVKNKLLVTITNNGPMIDEATRRKIFNPNFSTKKGGLSFGLGLGLAIVRRIVNSYGGTIVVKSDHQRTTFRIKLPIT
jgi:hypothetical protein